MGKGDIRSKRGKIYRGTFGKTRPKKKKKKAEQGFAAITIISFSCQQDGCFYVDPAPSWQPPLRLFLRPAYIVDILAFSQENSFPSKVIPPDAAR